MGRGVGHYFCVKNLQEINCAFKSPSYFLPVPNCPDMARRSSAIQYHC